MKSGRSGASMANYRRDYKSRFVLKRGRTVDNEKGRVVPGGPSATPGHVPLVVGRRSTSRRTIVRPLFLFRFGSFFSSVSFCFCASTDDDKNEAHRLEGKLAALLTWR